MFNDIFNKLMSSGVLPPEFQGMGPEDIKKEIMKNKGKLGPFMYGFNVNIGPDGKPTIDSFGNIKAKPGRPGKPSQPEVKDVREPLVEVNEQNDHIILIAEMPGVTKENIELKSTNYSITISTKKDDLGGRNYYKEIDLPSAIDPNYAKARYQNGILEVKLKKIEETQKKIQID